jgi:phage-related protein
MTPINFAVTAYKKTVDSLSEWIESFGIDEGMSDLLANLALGGTLIIGFRKSILAIVRSVGTIARIAGRLFVPLTVVITLFETIKGAIEGWNEDGFVGALKGAITEFGATLIAVPLDFIKGISAWVLEQLGFDETAEALNDFSFEEIWRNTVSAFFEGVKSMVEWVKLKFTDVTEAIESLWTGLVGAGKDLVSLLWSPIESAINWVKTLFTDPVEAFKQYFSTLLGVYTSIGELLFVPIDSAVTWIKNTFSDIKIEVPEWMKDIGGYLKNKLVKPIADFFEMITNFDFATLVPDWVKDIFGGPTTEVEPLDMIGGGAVDTGAIIKKAEPKSRLSRYCLIDYSFKSLRNSTSSSSSSSADSSVFHDEVSVSSSRVDFFSGSFAGALDGRSSPALEPPARTLSSCALSSS